MKIKIQNQNYFSEKIKSKMCTKIETLMSEIFDFPCKIYKQKSEKLKKLNQNLNFEKFSFLF